MLANFIELKEPVMTLAKFMSRIQCVKGIRVSTLMDDHIKVFSQKFPDDPGICFLISDKNHIRNGLRPFTFSACYNTQPDELHAFEAWRILRAAVAGLELHKEIVDALDFMLTEAFQPGSASSSSSLNRQMLPCPPPPPPARHFENRLVRDLALAYTFKHQDKEMYNRAKKLAKVEMPTALAIKAKLRIFKNERKERPLKKAVFLEDTKRFESTDGKVYCNAGNGIYADIFQERAEAIIERNAKIRKVQTKTAKRKLVAVVLFQYREEAKKGSRNALSYLENLIERKLKEIHGSTESMEAEELDSGSDVDTWDSDYHELTYEQAIREEPELFPHEPSDDFKEDMTNDYRMRHFKNIGPEEVRWRSMSLANEDLYSDSSFQFMVQRIADDSAEPWTAIWEPMDVVTSLDSYRQALPTSSCHERCKILLEDCRKRSLEFRAWNQEEDILEHKEYFFSSLPRKAEDKYVRYIDLSCKSKFQAVCGLVDLHNGEVVALPSFMTSSWDLTYLEDDSFWYNSFPDQFELGPNYFQPKLSESDRRCMSSQITEVCRDHPYLDQDISHNDLKPDRDNQWNRIVVPCYGTTEWAWLRSGKVTTLGEMFCKLCHAFTCRQIYDLYLCFEIVAVKKKKQRPQGRKRKAPPW